MLHRTRPHRSHGDVGASRGSRRSVASAAVGLTGAAALALGLASPALASHGAASGHRARAHYKPPIELLAVTPSPGDTAGAGGVFNVDLALLARNANGNADLSAANGYKPGVNGPPAATFGAGKPDPDAPGLVVTLSTTPAALGGPKTNLAGVFQLTDVARSHGLAQVIADWQVGKPGAFGQGSQTTLTAYVVAGTAPGTVTGAEKPISNVVSVRFTIGS
ncbi:MAG: hypothetical protein JOZ07_11895 [Solirubrobacterales bacterium]|nr:hypothetical protein [Solirubrobacterales bacterium]